MTRDEASGLLERITASPRLPDKHDVWIAEVCADVVGGEQAKESLQTIKQRHAVLIGKQPRQEGGAK